MIEQMLDSAVYRGSKNGLCLYNQQEMDFNNEGQVRYDASVGGFFCGVTEKNIFQLNILMKKIKVILWSFLQ